MKEEAGAGNIRVIRVRYGLGKLAHPLNWSEKTVQELSELM